MRRSPFGANGFNPEGIRIGAGGGRERRALKVWERREFRNFDDTLELGTRNLKLALRKLRKFAREGAAEELDLDVVASCVETPEQRASAVAMVSAKASISASWLPLSASVCCSCWP